MNTLYNIAQDFIALEQLIAEEQAGGHTEDDLDVVARWFEEMGGALEQKLQRCIAYVREQELLAVAAGSEADRLSEIKRIRENRVKRVKEAIKYVFEVQGLKRVETPLGAVTLAANGGKAPMELLKPVEELPAEHIKWTPTADADGIRARLEKGETLTFAILKPRGQHVRIQGGK